MTLKLNGTNSVAAPAYAGDDADTGLQCGTNELKLVTGGTARATVNSSGQVGIGTASPNYALHVSSASAVANQLQSSASSNVYTRLQNTDNSHGYLGYETKALAFYASNSGGTLSQKIGSWDADGLKFNSDSAATNALNDYEEGDWTPSMNNGGWTGFTINSAKYIKIGALVFVQCFVGPLTGSGNGGALKLGSLPFNSIASGYTAGTVDFGEGGVKGAYCRTESNSNLITFFYPSENNSQTRNVLLGNQIGDNYIIINLTYFTSA